MKADQVLKMVRLTEKSNLLSAELGQYTFQVDRAAGKHAIAAAVEQAFKVSVTRVNVINTAGKAKRSRVGRPGRTSDYKKAIVTLKAGDKIELI
ncbi:50S ribosomal protein L23 [Opitutaceae bacterium TAV4]|uniref:50S ribosomal protein L23 n=1 Tax=Geminisphaera colitermitum TaxID=1148786 RepID=UPI000158C9C4|nr:50S ribosomal protein L23 [Geminisphaera colitermitum]RRJ95377.1 50S ribosomal protein L23 [Opitutaceae bacterium TAV4]RRJ99975.1 50S ribosomal protein L23 [Opitutaceae bacterium TAV3]